MEGGRRKSKHLDSHSVTIFLYLYRYSERESVTSAHKRYTNSSETGCNAW